MLLKSKMSIIAVISSVTMSKLKYIKLLNSLRIKNLHFLFIIISALNLISDINKLLKFKMDDKND